MGIQFLLVNALQLILTSGVGAVFIIGYATKGIYVKEATPPDEEARFANDYAELMWLAERQKYHFDDEEARRFYLLRHSWSDMHSLPVSKQA